MRVLALAVLATTVLLPAGRALADADPPSDVLLVQNAYYPYNPPASKAATRQLDALIATAHRRGLPIKVALVATVADLGAVPDLFGKVQRYASFLEQEISFNSRPPLLVVMPGGYGVAGLPASPLRGLPKPGTTGDQLIRAAVLAIPRLAAAAGHPVPAPKPVVAGPGGKHSGPPTALIVLPVVLLLLAGVAGTLRNRRLRED